MSTSPHGTVTPRTPTQLNVSETSAATIVPPGSAAPRDAQLRKRIAVVGAGVAGLGAAFALSDQHDVTLFEADAQAGGHAKTVTIDYDGTPLAVDIGFMVLAPPIYPALTRLFAQLGVRTRATGMSFGVTDADGFAWAWTGKRDPRSWARNGLSAERRRLIAEILRFNQIAKRVARSDPHCAAPLQAFLAENGHGPEFATRYALPLVCAIWSLSLSAAARFPIGPLFAFMDRHRLLHVRAHGWRSVVGGSRTYVDRLLPEIGSVHLATPIQQVRRVAGRGVMVRDTAGRIYAFDAIVFATHPAETLAMLADADHEEHATLSAFRFEASDVVLHCDTALMPRSRAHWAAWNVSFGAAAPGRDPAVSVSYSLNRLQHVPRGMPLFVTVNPLRVPEATKSFGTYRLSHFQFDAAAAAAQARLLLRRERHRIEFRFRGLVTGHSSRTSKPCRKGRKARHALDQKRCEKRKQVED